MIAVVLFIVELVRLLFKLCIVIEFKLINFYVYLLVLFVILGFGGIIVYNIWFWFLWNLKFDGGEMFVYDF